MASGSTQLIFFSVIIDVVSNCNIGFKDTLYLFFQLIEIDISQIIKCEVGCECVEVLC